MDAPKNQKQKVPHEQRQTRVIRIAALIVFALLTVAGGAWLHSLGVTQHAYLNMPPYIVANLVTDIGMVFHLAGTLTWFMGAILLVSLVIHWFREEIIP